MYKSITSIVNDVKVTIDEIALNESGFESEKDNSEMDTIIGSKIPDALRFVYANADWSLLEPSEILDSESKEVEITQAGIGKVELPDDYIRLVYCKFNSWARYLGQEDIITWYDPRYAMFSDRYCTGTAMRPKVALGWRNGKKILEMYSAGTFKALAVFEGDENCVIRQGKYRKQLGKLVKQGEGWYVMTYENPEEEEDPVSKICVVTYADDVYKLTLIDTWEDPSVKGDKIEVGIMTEPEIVQITSQTGSGYIIPEKVYRSAVYYIAGLTLITYREVSMAQQMFSEANDLMGFTQMARPTQIQQPVVTPQQVEQ